MGIEELDFLKGELKKINAQIEELQYDSGGYISPREIMGIKRQD